MTKFENKIYLSDFNHLASYNTFYPYFGSPEHWWAQYLYDTMFTFPTGTRGIFHGCQLQLLLNWNKPQLLSIPLG